MKTSPWRSPEAKSPSRAGAPARALFVIDLKCGAILHWLKIEGVVSEFHDVIALPGVRRPQVVDLRRSASKPMKSGGF